MHCTSQLLVQDPRLRHSNWSPAAALTSACGRFRDAPCSFHAALKRRCSRLTFLLCIRQVLSVAASSQQPACCSLSQTVRMTSSQTASPDAAMHSVCAPALLGSEVLGFG